ncbi:hypothetical protein ACS0TY_030964 [Phlomoides rotata]
MKKQLNRSFVNILWKKYQLDSFLKQRQQAKHKDKIEDSNRDLIQKFLLLCSSFEMAVTEGFFMLAYSFFYVLHLKGRLLKA